MEGVEDIRPLKGLLATLAERWSVPIELLTDAEWTRVSGTWLEEPCRLRELDSDELRRMRIPSSGYEIVWTRFERVTLIIYLDFMGEGPARTPVIKTVSADDRRPCRPQTTSGGRIIPRFAQTADYDDRSDD